MTRDNFNHQYKISPDRLAHLTSVFIRDAITDDESNELDSWLDGPVSNTLLFEKMVVPEKFEKEATLFYDTGIDELRRKILKFLLTGQQSFTAVYHITWVRVAAAVLIVAGVLLFTLLQKKTTPEKQAVLVPTLTMPGGKKIDLSVKGWTEAGNSKDAVISKESGNELRYSYNGSAKQSDHSYLLETSSDAAYKIMLQDGTKVWVNRNSSIEFPEVFSEDSREVKITGNVFFEVREDGRPFIASFSDGQVRSRRGYFDIRDFPGTYSTVLLETGDAQLQLRFTKAELLPNHITTIEKGEFLRQIKMDTTVTTITGWRYRIPVVPQEGDNKTLKDSQQAQTKRDTLR